MLEQALEEDVQVCFCLQQCLQLQLDYLLLVVSSKAKIGDCATSVRSLVGNSFKYEINTFYLFHRFNI
jgi:hypothetical protein